jgi:hypothetical protein
VKTLKRWNRDGLRRGTRRATLRIVVRLAYSLARLVRKSAQTAGAALQEIFDEAAYGRFLQRKHATPSRQTYAAFLRDMEDTKARRPRCC